MNNQQEALKIAQELRDWENVTKHSYFALSNLIIKAADALSEQAEQAQPAGYFYHDKHDGGEWKHIADTKEQADKYDGIVIPLYKNLKCIEKPFAYFQKHPISGAWEEVLASSANDDGVVAAYRVPQIQSPKTVEEFAKTISFTQQVSLDERQRLIEQVNDLKMQLENKKTEWQPIATAPKET